MTTFERLKNVCDSVFEGEIDTTNITVESNLRDDIGINSIGVLYMAMALEEEFDIKFTNDDFAYITTVSDVVAIIEKKAKK
ncbi:MAG: acyl carrier protein [Ruminococcaceae bacterium]|nr:acyl carrier protein [Oscillospiraceae bacterium]